LSIYIADSRETTEKGKEKKSIVDMLKKEKNGMT
jgi:hypothetical protein